MMQSKAFWCFLMLGAIALFFAAVALGRYLFPDNSILSWIFFIFLVLLHAAEIPHSIKIGRKKRVSTPRTVLFTLFFGFTWWLPLKKGIINR